MPRFEVEAGGRRFEVEAPDGRTAVTAVTAPGRLPVFSIQIPDGRVVDIEAGDQATALRGAREWSEANPKPEQSWGGYFKGLGREAVQGATFDLGDELGLTDRAASEQFSQENPIASTAARIAGSLPTFALGPGAAAARWATAGSSLARTAGRSALLGAGAGAAAGAGAGEGLEGRLAGAGTGALFGAGIGAAVPPVAAGVRRSGPRRRQRPVAPAGADEASCRRLRL